MHLWGLLQLRSELCQLCFKLPKMIFRGLHRGPLVVARPMLAMLARKEATQTYLILLRPIHLHFYFLDFCSETQHKLYLNSKAL